MILASFFFYRVFQYPTKWCIYSAVWLLHVWLLHVWLLHGWYHVKLLPSGRPFCVHHTIMLHFTVSLHTQPHPFHLRQNERNRLRAAAVKRELNGYRTCVCLCVCVCVCVCVCARARAHARACMREREGERGREIVLVLLLLYPVQNKSFCIAENQ